MHELDSKKKIIHTYKIIFRLRKYILLHLFLKPTIYNNISTKDVHLHSVVNFIKKLVTLIKLQSRMPLK